MPTPEEVQFEANLKLLMSIPFDGLLKEDRDALRDEMSRIKDDYDAALNLAKADKANEKYYKDVSDVLAKSLPNIAKSAFSASDAFRKGDYISGAAAVLDICASVIPVFASVFSAAGPGTAPIGALFAVIGQILAFFAPKQPSLKDQIEKMLDHLKSEQEIQNMKAVGHSIEVYTRDLRSKCVGVPEPSGRKSIAQILAMPLQTEPQADAFIVEMKALEFGLVRGQQKLDIPAFATWEVAGYLERTGNQGKEGWPEVLGYWCRAYTDLLSANVMLNSLANPRTITERIRETDIGTASPLPQQKKDHCNEALLSLKALAQELRDAWRSDNEVALRVLKAVAPAARDRGLWIGTSAAQCVYIAIGRKGQLEWAYKSNTTYVTRFSVNATNEQVGSLTPRYELFALGTGEVHRHSLDATRGDLSDGVKVFCDEPVLPGDVSGGFDSSRDVYWLPDDRFPAAARLYTVNGYGEEWGSSHGRHWVHNHLVAADGNATRVNWRPEVSNGVRDVRALRHPAATAPDDPDGPAMDDRNATPLGPLVSPQQEIVYAGYTDKSSVWVQTLNVSAHVSSPWTTYDGIAVSPYYLWVFGQQGFACATHSSIIRTIRGELSSPRWITYALQDTDFAHAYPNMSPSDLESLVGSYKVTSLHPCADGTLSVTVYPWAMFTAGYEIRLKEQRIVTHSWVHRGAGMSPIEKMPIPCWSLYASLVANLESVAARR